MDFTLRVSRFYDFELKENEAIDLRQLFEGLQDEEITAVMRRMHITGNRAKRLKATVGNFKQALSEVRHADSDETD